MTLWCGQLARECDGGMSELERITVIRISAVDAPYLRGLRVRVTDVLDLLAAGASHKEILADYPYLEQGDLTAALEASHS